MFVITRVSYFLIDNEIADNYYARADIALPTFDRSGIDALALVDQEKKQYKVVTDKNLLDKLWDTLESNEKKNEDSGNFFPSEQELWFMNSNFPGISIQLPVYVIDDDKYMINMAYDGKYRGISQDLIEQIAGQKLPTASEYIASQQKTAD